MILGHMLSATVLGKDIDEMDIPLWEMRQKGQFHKCDQCLCIFSLVLSKSSVMRCCYEK